MKDNDEVIKRLNSLNPSFITVHKETEDVLNILVVSSQFKDARITQRVSMCLDLLDGIINETDGLPYLFIIKPFTLDEYLPICNRGCK